LKLIKEDVSYIFFLEKKKDEYELLKNKKSILKSDIFLADRIEKEVMRWRIERADIVVLAKVTAKKKQEDGPNFIECKAIELFKGNTNPTFTMTYGKDLKTPIIRSISYIFLLKQQQGSYSLINSHEGARLASDYRYLEQIKIATKVENPLDKVAGKAEKSGLRASARVNRDIVQNDMRVSVVVQNTSRKDQEIYYNSTLMDYFTVFHIFDQSGKKISVKYPRKSSVPSINARHFTPLKSNGFVLLPPFSLSQYVQLSSGKYTLYVEFHLPWEYAGESLGKEGWTGKIISNKVEIQIP
jgi:hypothetical protein